jgi:hypothetical protein
MRDAIARSSGRRLALAGTAAVLVIAAVVVVLVLLLSGDREDAAAAIDRALQQPIESAQVGLDAELRVEGLPQLPTPITVRAAGPYRSGGGRTIPSFDLNVALTGAGRNVAARFVSTATNAFVVFQGVAYEVGEADVADTNRRLAAGRAAPRPPSLRELGVDARSWLVDPEERGDEELAGVETTHYAAGIDVVRLLDDLNRATAQAAARIGRPPPQRLTELQRDELRRVARNATMDVYVGQDDGKIRRLDLRVPFAVPLERRTQAAGATGGQLAVSLQLSELGRPVRVAAPPNPRPIKDLRRQVGPLGAAPPSAR